MIKILSPEGYLPLSLAMYMYKIVLKCFLLCNRSSRFHQISHGAFCRKDTDHFYEWFSAIEQTGSLSYTVDSRYHDLAYLE